MFRNGWVWVTRCPAKTALPSWPGTALPGQCPGPWSMTVRVTPSKMGWTSPILGIRISPILTIGAGAVGLAGGAMGPVRGAGAPSGRVVVVVGGTGRSSTIAAGAAVAAGAAPATASAELPWSTATTTPLIMTTPIRAASTGTAGTRQRRRDRSAGGDKEWRSSGEPDGWDSRVSWPGSPGGGEVDTQRLFALAGATPAGATELQSGGTYVPIEALAAIAGNSGSSRRDHRHQPQKLSSSSLLTRTSPKQTVHQEIPANVVSPLDDIPPALEGGGAANALASATE